jgi:hypothetical protein
LTPQKATENAKRHENCFKLAVFEVENILEVETASDKSGLGIDAIEPSKALLQCASIVPKDFERLRSVMSSLRAMGRKLFAAFFKSFPTTSEAVRGDGATRDTVPIRQGRERFAVVSLTC